MIMFMIMLCGDAYRDNRGKHSTRTAAVYLTLSVKAVFVFRY